MYQLFRTHSPVTINTHHLPTTVSARSGLLAFDLSAAEVQHWQKVLERPILRGGGQIAGAIVLAQLVSREPRPRLAPHLPILHVPFEEAPCPNWLACHLHADFCLRADKLDSAKAILHFLESGRLLPEMWGLETVRLHCIARRALEILLSQPLAFSSVTALSASLRLRRHTLAACFAQDSGIPLWRFLQLVRKAVILRWHVQEGQSLREIHVREAVLGVENFWRDVAHHLGVKRPQLLSGERHWLWHVLAACEKLRAKKFCPI